MWELLVAVAGALVGYAGRRVQDRRRERSEFAARAVSRSDLEDAFSAVKLTLEREEWPTGTDRAWVQTWRDNRAILAGGLPSLQFDTLARAYARMDELDSGLNAPRAPGERMLSSPDEELLNDMRRLIEPTLDVFGPAQTGVIPVRQAGSIHTGTMPTGEAYGVPIQKFPRQPPTTLTPTVAIPRPRSRRDSLSLAKEFLRHGRLGGRARSGRLRRPGPPRNRVPLSRFATMPPVLST